MPAFNYRKIQASFTNGEVSPRLLARTDLDTYGTGVKTMENAFVLPHGGAKKRPGTIYVGAVSDSTKVVRLIPFVYSRTVSYVLVFNNGKIQFIKNGSWVMNGSSRYEISHTYTDAELPELTYAQYGSSMFIAHSNHVPRQLYRTTETNWSLSSISFTYYALSDQWFQNGYVTFKIITTENGFNVGDKFTFVVASDGTITGPSWTTKTGTGDVVQISSNSSNIVAQTWTVTCVFATLGRQEWSVTGSAITTAHHPCRWYANNYPKAVSFYEQRLYFAGSAAYPQTIWGSKAGRYTDFTLGPLDDDGVEFTIASNKFDQLLHLESTRHLLPLGYGGEFSLAGGSNGGVTPSTVAIRAHTTHGITDVKPLRVGEEVLFVQRDGLKVRAISYDVTLDANVAPDITLLAEHITEGKLVDMTYSQSPDSLVWAVRGDGVLLSCTHIRGQNVTAWSRHITDGLFKNITNIPEGGGDTIYLCVQRTINSSTVKYIEYFDTDTYVDCALWGEDESGATTWTGLGHLEKKTITILADGKTHPTEQVNSGEITLDYSANEIQVGLPFTTTIELLHPEIQTSVGTTQGAALSVHEAVLRLQDTVGLKVNTRVIPVMTTLSTLDSAPTPYTGDVKVGQLGWSSPNNLSIVHDYPQPFTLLGVILKCTVGD